VIETTRTLLRPIAPEDAELVFSYRSDSEANKYQSWIPNSLDQVIKFISKNPDKINQPESWFQLVIIEKITAKIIGDIGIHFIGHDNFQSEIGITLSKKSQNKGFAIETMTAIIDYLFNELKKHRIVTSIDPKNINSIKLVERLGFRKEGHFKESLMIDGQWVDDIIYAMLRRDWIKS